MEAIATRQVTMLGIGQDGQMDECLGEPEDQDVMDEMCGSDIEVCKSSRDWAKPWADSLRQKFE